LMTHLRCITIMYLPNLGLHLSVTCVCVVSEPALVLTC